ncbi:uncharacterized protein LOC134770790 [Penaeus indicus]|uniref:uncharacterized protein LOC134770790 n=1 Tax=Penaeus indicus TaxID=29960 RepID=UPI00300CED80
MLSEVASTWGICLMLNSGELNRLGAEEAALSEVRRPDRSMISMELTLVDEHIMALRLKHAAGFVPLITVYAPIDVCKLGEKEAFYAKLTSVADKRPQQDIPIVLGDYNAVSNCDQAGYEMSTGPNRPRDRGFLAVQCPDPHHWTWHSYMGTVAKGIDYIHVSTCWRILQNFRFIRNLDEEVEDHFLVNDLHPAYKALKQLNSKPSSKMTSVCSAYGQITSDHIGVLRLCWAEYFV